MDPSRSNDRAISRSARTEQEGLVAVPAGDGVTLITTDTDPAGGIMYLIEGGKQRMLQIGEELADARIGLIDTSRFLVMLDPATNRLRAFCTLFGGSRIYFFGSKWGFWLDEEGAMTKSPDIMQRMKTSRVPVAFNLEGTELMIEINVNPHFRSAFTQDTISVFDFRANSHQIQIAFDIPSGKFKRAKVLIQKDRGQDTASLSYGVRGFPLIWPALAPNAPASNVPPRPVASLPAEEPVRIKMAPKPVADSIPGDETTSGRVKLRPKSSDGWDPPPVASPPVGQQTSGTPRATMLPRSEGSGSGEYKAAASPPPREAEPPRIKLRPAPASGFSKPDSGGFSRVSSDSRPNPSPAEGRGSFAEGWIDDLLTTQPRSDEAETASDIKPVRRGSESIPKAPTEGMQASKKGVLTIPIQQLPIERLIERVEEETDAEIRWKMIEQNLILGREERTYQLVSRFAEQIHERTPSWPPARLKLAFGRIPGGILFGVMYPWKVNQVLAVAEENPENEKIMTWLRERELERMLQIDTSVELTTIESARRDLCVDKNADEAAVKKTWRTLLSFLNADHGRQDERAIHRKKDEIAKHLQTARNVILRQK